jgi:hypothetical protein
MEPIRVAKRSESPRACADVLGSPKDSAVGKLIEDSREGAGGVPIGAVCFGELPDGWLNFRRLSRFEVRGASAG